MEVTEVKVLLTSAAKAHRASGDALFHAITGGALLAVLALKVVVLRWWHAAGGFLPVLGISVFVLLALTWFSTVGSYFSEA